MVKNLNFQFCKLSFIKTDSEELSQLENTILMKSIFEEYKQAFPLKKALSKTQYGFSASAQDSGNCRLLRITDIKEDGINWATVPFCDCSEIDKYKLDEKDILIARTGGTTGKTMLIQNIEETSVFASYLIRLSVSEDYNPEYIYLFLNSYLFWNQILDLKNGTAQPNVNANKMTTIIFPSCPKEIQDEIVEYKKDKSLKNYVLKQAQFYFHKINIVHQNLKLIISENEKQSEIISKLKQAILQEASAGQLTAEWRTQNPMQKGNPDTDAAALLAKIKAEKQQLIAEGKLKKEKPLPEISPDEIPFSLPDSWVWCRLVEIAEGFEYGSSSKSLKSGKVPVLRMGNLQNGLVDLTDLVYTNEEKEIEQYALFYGDLLFNRTNSRELVGKTSLFLYDKKMIYAGYLVRYRMLGSISFQYTNYVMNSQLHRDWCHTIKVDAIGQSNINATKLRSFCFPLPPLAEQKAIVEKVDRLMNIIDQLEQQIKHRKQLAEDLIQTVLREAFE